jgi:DNA modification methylase
VNDYPEPNAADRPWRTYENVFMFSKSRSYHFNRKALEATKSEDVWTLESRPRPGGGHPAVFPLELVRRCLQIGNPQLGPVIDPFAGSATVMRASLEMGAAADGIDISARYCAASAASLEKASEVFISL